MKTKLEMGLMGSLGLDTEGQIRLMREIGFDGCFCGWRRTTDLSETVRLAERYGMEIGSLHAPFDSCDKLWEMSDETEDAVDEIIGCVRACAEYEIPVTVAHVIIGFDKHTPNEAGLHNFARIVDEAERLGVMIAFENTEGTEYLDAVMEYFKGSAAVGFCLDTGHEICYNPGRDMLNAYGGRTIYTHINDNLGVCGDEITWLDDLHLLPFDGVCDFDGVARRLAESGYRGPLSFELSRSSKPGRCENDAYAVMGAEEYLREAYRRAVKIRELFDGYRKN